MATWDEILAALENVDLDRYRKLKDNLAAVNEELKKLEIGSNAYKQAQEKADGLQKTMEEIKNKAPEVAKSFIESGREISSAALAPFTAFKTVTGGLFDNMDEVATGMIKSLKSIPETAAFVFSDFGKTLIDPVKDNSEAIGQLFGKTAGEINTSMSSLLDTQSVARQAFIQTGEGIDKADEAADKYIQDLKRMTVAFGLSGKEMVAMDRTLSVIGRDAIEASSGWSELTGSMNEVIKPSAAIATAYRGLGFEASESANMARESFLKFNETAKQSTMDVGVFAEAAEEAGKVNRRLATDQIRQASQSLAIFGQSSTSAANLWTTFTKALRDDVPLEQTGQMVSKLTSGLANMRLENRAFISMISGLNQGATALGGGLKMELAMRTEGGLEKNLQALTESIGKFGGGQIITLEQAANNPQLEMQFQVQRQMLGSLAGISDAQDQNRVLEVMQEVQRGGISQIEGGRKLQEVFQEGEDIQQKQLTSMEKIANSAALTSARAEQIVMLLNRSISPTNYQVNQLGTATERGREIEAPLMTKIVTDMFTGIRNIPRTFETFAETNKPIDFSQVGANFKRGIQDSEFVDERGILNENVPITKGPTHMGLPAPTERTMTGLMELEKAMLNRRENPPENIENLRPGVNLPAPRITTNPEEKTIIVKITADDEAFEHIQEKVYNRVTTALSRASYGMPRE